MMRSSEEVLVTVAGDTLLGNEYANGMAGVGDALWASNNGEKGGRSEEGERDEMGGECADALDTSRCYSGEPRARCAPVSASWALLGRLSSTSSPLVDNLCYLYSACCSPDTSPACPHTKINHLTLQHTLSELWLHPETREWRTPTSSRMTKG